jgi:hypothetical protein
MTGKVECRIQKPTLEVNGERITQLDEECRRKETR